MLDCPYCDQPVIEGSDECDSCGHPLMDTHLPTPQSEVELGLLTDRLASGVTRWPLLISPTMPIRECLRLLVDNRIGCLLVVENAQNMHPSVLEELRCLAAIQAEGARILKILLLGQPSLNLVLDSPRMAELVAGSVPRYSLGPLSEDQTAAYVAHRLRAAGAPDPDRLMPHTFMPQIHACTGGVPARINRLCAQALAFARESEPPMPAYAMEDVWG